jgi:quinol-cytochrome oxidoreductase complex cytochrome b subunit
MRPDVKRLHAHHHRRMPRRQRLAVYAISAVLWVSGLLWLLLELFFARQDQFGRAPHPLQPPLLLIHGVIAILAMYVLGWVSARHVVRWWTEGQRRVSGAAFTVVLCVLTLSGFALFFVSDDQWQHVSKLTHEVLGVGVTLLAAQHWFFGRRVHSAHVSRSRLGPSSHLHP